MRKDLDKKGVLELLFGRRRAAMIPKVDPAGYQFYRGLAAGLLQWFMDDLTGTRARKTEIYDVNARVWGEGFGTTQAEADQNAWADLRSKGAGQQPPCAVAP